jgi:hypothetical protein
MLTALIMLKKPVQKVAPSTPVPIAVPVQTKVVSMTKETALVENE